MAVALGLVRGPAFFYVVVAVGRGFGEALEDLSKLQFYATVMVNRRGGYLWSSTSYVRSMPPIDGDATIYVCEEGVCELPTKEPSKALKYVERRRFKPLT